MGRSDPSIIYKIKIIQVIHLGGKTDMAMQFIFAYNPFY